MAAHADHLGAVPAEEGSRSEADVSGMADAAQADGAALPLIGQGPAKPEETNGEGPGELGKFGDWRVVGGIPIGEVERNEVSDRRDQREFRPEERPAIKGPLVRRAVMAVVGFAHSHGCDRGQGKQGEDQCELKKSPGSLEPVGK